MHVPMWIWGLTILGVAALLLFDFFSHVRDPHEPTLREAGLWTAFTRGWPSSSASGCGPSGVATTASSFSLGS